MQTAKADFIHRLLPWATVIALGNVVVVLAHLSLVVRIQPDFSRSAILGLILVNLLAAIRVLALKKGYRKLAAILIANPLSVGFVIGSYSHFRSSGTDNVFRIAAGELTLPYQVRPVLFVLIETLRLWVGVRPLTYRT
jgi:hypothetical protein